MSHDSTTPNTVDNSNNNDDDIATADTPVICNNDSDIVATTVAENTDTSTASSPPAKRRRTQAQYIVIEGVDGVGKTTQCIKLLQHLRQCGFRVLITKEPGTSDLPLTMELRKLMLDKQFDHELTPIAREYLSQSIRAIHLTHLIKDALDQYDYIIQDRGLLSGLAYGHACGNDLDKLWELASLTCKSAGFDDLKTLYTNVVLLQMDETDAAARIASRDAATKTEFAAGDAIEGRGLPFMKQVSSTMNALADRFHVTKIPITAQESADDVFAKVLDTLRAL